MATWVEIAAAAGFDDPFEISDDFVFTIVGCLKAAGYCSAESDMWRLAAKREAEKLDAQTGREGENHKLKDDVRRLTRENEEDLLDVAELKQKLAGLPKLQADFDIADQERHDFRREVSSLELVVKTREETIRVMKGKIEAMSEHIRALRAGEE